MRFSELDGRVVAVWGVGVEVTSFAVQVARRLPRTRIATVILDDVGEANDAAALMAAGATVVDAEHALEAAGSCDVLVRSPGVSLYRPEVQALLASGTPVTTPTSLWLAERGGRGVIGVTATKGKSTTAALIAHLARACGIKAHLAGNIGRSALELLDEDESELAVVELSSYQIADLAVGPETALVGNLFKEHVTWHGTEAAYRADKLRILTLPGVTRCVLNGTLPDVVRAPRTCEQTLLFGTPDGWHVRPDGIGLGDTLMVASQDLPLAGRHNALNICAAVTALAAVGIGPPELPQALAGFRALPHRLQTIAEVAGVRWVDDSISTTPESTIAAIEAFPENQIVLLAGGSDRQQEYEQLGDVLAARGATVLGMPDTGARLVEAAARAGIAGERAVTVGHLAEAVARARRAASTGSVVLLSPAAPSYNAYRNFGARGDHFRDLVLAGGPDAIRREIVEWIEAWAGAPALAGLLDRHDGPSRGSQTLDAWLDELESFSIRWDYRAGRESNLVEDPQFAPAETEAINAAAQALGLCGPNEPRHEHYDVIVILGGLVRACLARAQHAARLIGDRRITVDRVVALGGYRPLRGDEVELAERMIGTHARNELDAIDAGARAAFDLDAPTCVDGVASDVVGVGWAVHEYRTRDGTAVDVVAAPSSEPGVRRANTADTYAWLANTSRLLAPGSRCLIVTTSIYRPFQTADAIRMLRLPLEVSVDAVGIEPGAIDPRLDQHFGAHNYLQEIRSTIRAMGMLLRAASQQH